jgi:hypothetical protein
MKNTRKNIGDSTPFLPQKYKHKAMRNNFRRRKSGEDGYFYFLIRSLAVYS